MKLRKTTLILLLSIICCGFIACGEDDKDDDEPIVEQQKYTFKKESAEESLKKRFYRQNAKSFEVRYISFDRSETYFDSYDFSVVVYYDNSKSIITGQLGFFFYSNTYSVNSSSSEIVWYE